MSDTLNEQLLDEDELLAVKEVRLAYDNMKVVDCLDISADGTAAWDAAYQRCVYRGGKGWDQGVIWCGITPGVCCDVARLQLPKSIFPLHFQLLTRHANRLNVKD